MRREIWERLLERSAGMTRPAHVQGAVLPEGIARYHALYADVFRAFCRQGRPEAGLKVFVDRVFDTNARERFVQSPPREDESLEEWCGRMSGGHTFGVILNNLERYSDDFAAAVATGTSSLLDLTGLPLGGLAFLCFMGNYGLTPFGVHKENVGEEGLLFHMGPGRKTFYTWRTERFLELSGGATLLSVTDDVLAQAEHAFSLSPGDVVFIPADVFHVADTPEFSFSMVMDFINPPVDFFKRGMARRLLEEDAPPAGPPYLSPVRVATESDDVRDIARASTLDTELRAAIEDHVLRLRSNQGYYTAAAQRTTAMSLPPGGRIRVVAPFPVLSRERADGRLDVYARGHRRACDAHPRLAAFLGRLNAGEAFTLDELCAEFAPEWTTQETLQLLSMLHGLATVRAEAPTIAR